MPKITYTAIDLSPYLCSNCKNKQLKPVNERPAFRCRVFTEFYFENNPQALCPAFCDSASKMLDIERDCIRYAKDRDAGELYIERLKQRADYYEKDIDRESTADITRAFYEDTHRGSRGGGGDKEKAPNKAKAKKYSTQQLYNMLGS